MNCQTGKRIFLSRLEGFTLIEIILVLMIFSVITALAIPNFRQVFQKIQVKTAAYDIVYAMRYAQSRAVTFQRVVRFEFSNDFTRYWLSESLDEDTEDEPMVSGQKFNRLSGRFGRTFSVPKDVFINAQESILSFYPDGKIDRQLLSVCPKGKKDRCVMITTNAQRGRVRIYENQDEFKE